MWVKVFSFKSSFFEDFVSPFVYHSDIYQVLTIYQALCPALSLQPTEVGTLTHSASTHSLLPCLLLSVAFSESWVLQ